jgi:hypothetical protein
LPNVNWSLEVALDVPTGVVTVTCATPAACAGDVAVIELLESTVKLAAAVVPKRTAVAPVRVVPVIVTDVPPPTSPTFGLTAVTVGALRYVYPFVTVVEPPLAVTTTSTAPAAWAGVRTSISPDPFPPEIVAATPPNVTLVPELTQVPVIAIRSFPLRRPLAGVIAVTTGTGAVNVSVNGRAFDVPPGDVTVRNVGMMKAPSAGVIAVIVESSTTTTDEKVRAPRFTDVVPVRLEPLIVTGNDPPT